MRTQTRRPFLPIFIALSAIVLPIRGAFADPHLDLRATGASNTPFRDRLFTLNAQDAPTALVMKKIFELAQVNYEIGPDVSGTVTLKMQNVSFDVLTHAVFHAARPRMTYDMTGGRYNIKRYKGQPK